LDLETGFSTGNYSYVDSAAFLAGTTMPSRRIIPGTEYDDSVVTDGTLSSVYFAPRLSFGLGRRTGVTMTYSYRSFLDRNDNACIYGLSSTYLSQWNTDHEGSAFTISVKTYLVPHFILSAGMGYFDKQYLNALERIQIGNLVPPPGVGIPQAVVDRNDKQTRLYVSAQLPCANRTGPMLEPSLQIEYTRNKSSVYLYDYDDVTVTAGLSMKL